MALCSVSNAVHTVDDSVHCGVVADGIVGTVKVVVDGSGQSDAADVMLLSKVHGSSERTVTADNDQSVYLGSL